MKFAVLSFVEPSEALKRVIVKASSVLSQRATLATTPDSVMNMTFYKVYRGNKELYSEESIPESGYPVYVNPTFGNLRKLGMKQVSGFHKLTPHRKSLAYSTLACLYGLEGKESINPFVTTKFIVTFSEPESSRHDDQQFCLAIARRLGFKIIDLADKQGRKTFAAVLKKLSVTGQESNDDRTHSRELHRR